MIAGDRAASPNRMPSPAMTRVAATESHNNRASNSLRNRMTRSICIVRHSDFDTSKTAQRSSGADLDVVAADAGWRWDLPAWVHRIYPVPGDGRLLSPVGARAAD